MNIFDDLIDELKKENLLEKTDGSAKKAVVVDGGEMPASDEKNAAADSLNVAPDDNVRDDANKLKSAPAPASAQPSAEAKKIDDTEFFRRRATEEVAGLQMVEHVFSGIERDQKKIVPKPYDDLQVKKALHNFLQTVADVNSSEHAGVEFDLMQETESWCSALSLRDKQISVANLRRFCETSRPALSSPALLALARFYRNSPYSEAVRSKFDLIVTRLFSKDLWDDKRELTFSRDESIRHLSELYAEWSSISLYEGDEDESKIVLTAFKFEDFMSEALKAESFDELIKTDFFNRLRNFKQNAGEQFFAPLVTATAVECNINIGNRYVELLELEKGKGELEKLENKYGFLHDQVISDAASKSLQLVELLKTKTPPPPEIVEAKKEVASAAAEAPKPPAINASAPANARKSFFGVNKWLLGSAAAALFFSVALMLWSNNLTAPAAMSQDVTKVNIDNSSLKEHIRDARVGNNTFFAVVLPSWNALNPEKKEEILKKIAAIGADRGFKNVHLLSADGKSVGTAVGDVVEVKN